MKKLILPFLFIVCLLMTACSTNNEPENEPEAISPIHFNSRDYTIMFGVTGSIPFTDGGGVYEFEVGNPDVLGNIDIETHQLLINPTKPGESTLTIIDVKAETAVTLNITVEDFYRSFKIVEVEGKNTNIFFQIQHRIRFIRNKDNTKPVKVVWTDPMDFRLRTLGEGHFNIIRNENNTFIMRFSLHSPIEERPETFEYAIDWDWECMSLFEELFGFDWNKNAALSRSEQPVREYKMILTDTFNGCQITCLLQKI
ncbi:MAG: hypothetical protein K2L22_08575 [Muribaculaceae bacterium]|nr:hypothetical protein [Muribaculaceae bacterium]